MPQLQKKFSSDQVGLEGVCEGRILFYDRELLFAQGQYNLFNDAEKVMVSFFNRKEFMNKQWISLLFVLSSLQLSYATLGKNDVYISYSEQLHFRAGINYKHYGFFIRPIFNKQSHSYYSATD